MRGRRHRGDVARREGRRDRGRGVLGGRVPAERAHRVVPEGLCGDHGRHRARRRDRPVRARTAAGRHRALRDRHAGDRDRLPARRRRHLPALPRARRDRHAPRPDRGLGRRGRRDRDRLRRPLRPPPRSLPGLLAALATTDADEALAAFEEPAPPSPLAQARPWLDTAYAGDDALAILARLRALGTEDATRAADAIEAKSPTSVKVTLRALREAAGMDRLEPALDLEYRLALGFHTSHDFVEGVRAQVVDKDRDPQWQPATLAEVAAADVAAYFAPVGERELGLADR
ncbi:enoyl-CoA hydratase/isomerase family protein [Nocardioides convexus]|uniref:enoyl-CoA hydratase/isomerase family protein n=1 Tax=Nocardioides convexus TaxID=2712224 RepID=UPI0024189BA5|nr:enoyl-CoA hydratase/isomerase family protein [Nocardioides convexus]